jgi:DNA polymerase-4
MDAFFAAVEQREDPALRGKPLLIGHDGPRGVVATASYEARPFGCHSAQPMAVAKRLCPHAVILPVRMALYKQVSTRMFTILDEFSPIVEPLSIDEAFLDLTGSEAALGPAGEVARRLKDRIRAELRITASVGVAPNKFLAKLASDMNKPDGLTIIGAADVDRILPPMPVTKLWGIGNATARRLANLGIRTVGDLRAKPKKWADELLGSEAERYVRLAHGIDDRPVVPDREAKSISHEHTFGEDVADPATIRNLLLEQVEQVAARLRRHALKARGVSLKIRYGDFQTVNRSTTLPSSTDSTAELWQSARELFDRWDFRPVRLIGVAAERLLGSDSPGQMMLFSDPDREKQRKLDAVADQINQRFGKQAIRRGGASEGQDDSSVESKRVSAFAPNDKRLPAAIRVWTPLVVWRDRRHVW